MSMPHVLYQEKFMCSRTNGKLMCRQLSIARNPWRRDRGCVDAVRGRLRCPGGKHDKWTGTTCCGRCPGTSIRANYLRCSAALHTDCLRCSGGLRRPGIVCPGNRLDTCLVACAVLVACPILAPFPIQHPIGVGTVQRH